MENTKYTDKIILYNMAILFPVLALIITIILGYGKQKDAFLERIKYISWYEIMQIVVVSFSYYLGGTNGVSISLIILLVFYMFMSGLVAYKKEDYFSRGLALGLFTSHYALALYHSSGNSNAKINNSEYPDTGLALFLMISKLFWILFIYFLINKFIPNIIIKLSGGII